MNYRTMQHGAEVRAADLERAIAEAEERGKRWAIDELRAEAATLYDSQPVTSNHYRQTADYLESRLAGEQP